MKRETSPEETNVAVNGAAVRERLSDIIVTYQNTQVLGKSSLGLGPFYPLDVTCFKSGPCFSHSPLLSAVRHRPRVRFFMHVRHGVKQALLMCCTFYHLDVLYILVCSVYPQTLKGHEGQETGTPIICIRPFFFCIQPEGKHFVPCQTTHTRRPLLPYGFFEEGKSSEKIFSQTPKDKKNKLRQTKQPACAVCSVSILSTVHSQLGVQPNGWVRFEFSNPADLVPNTHTHTRILMEHK